jgi:hypothetical protein
VASITALYILLLNHLYGGVNIDRNAGVKFTGIYRQAKKEKDLDQNA